MGNDWYMADLNIKPSSKHSSTRVGHWLLLLMLVCILVALFLPLWQRGVNRALELEYQTLLQNRQALEEQQQVLSASISQLSMPEALVNGAWKQNLVFQPIKTEAIVSVGGGSV
ncbi:MAG: hypothetical protein AB7C91_12075 [Sphaerochaeta sp.]|jgi:type II secretory pathway pseudopilin PulG|uniref:hypothetical protein n=1 Tax=Sphaerochaeta sp. TaxID=1972642 RepID=UPI002FC98910